MTAEALHSFSFSLTLASQVVKPNFYARVVAAVIVEMHFIFLTSHLGLAGINLIGSFKWAPNCISYFTIRPTDVLHV